MLEVQKFLQHKTYDNLTSELGITVNRHPTLPIAILNYDQIKSPKTNPIVRECRGLILNYETNAIVAKGFNRFFNWGEVIEESKSFNFGDFVVQSKEDGSYVSLFNFDNKWHMATRNSFCDGPIWPHDIKWSDCILRALKTSSLDELNLDKRFTYICEFCSPWNKTVRSYLEPTMYLLTITENGHELHHSEVDNVIATSLGWPKHTAGCFVRPLKFQFKSIDEIRSYILKKSREDATFEGVVINDSNSRWKIKSSTYIALHRLSNNNSFEPKIIVPLVLANELDEILTYFPEVTGKVNKIKNIIDAEYSNLIKLWYDTKDIEPQKDFALAIKGNKFSSLLFNIRHKYGKTQTKANVDEIWQSSSNLIVKLLEFNN